MPNALTESHRLAQVRLGAQTVRLLVAAFGLLDPSALDDTADRWLRIAVPIVQAQRRISTDLAVQYLTAFRASALGLEAGFSPVLADEGDVSKIATSLLVTGPVRIKSAMRRGTPLDRAVDIANASQAAAGMRHALDAGRETLVETMKADPAVGGWQRVTSGRACAFCRMLADRGAVYKEATADFASHDHCSCSAEPVFGDVKRRARDFVPSTRQRGPDARLDTARKHLRETRSEILAETDPARLGRLREREQKWSQRVADLRANPGAGTADRTRLREYLAENYPKV